MTKKTKIQKKRRPHKVRLFILAFLFVVLIGFLGLKLTENGSFTVMGVFEDQVVEQGTYKHFWFAKLKMNFLDTENAYIQREDGKAVAISQGYVNLKTKSINENTLYTNNENGEQGYTNGSYGADALYLDTSMDGTQVLMKISGVKGWVNVEEIQLYLYDESLYNSSYSVYKGSLVHTISTDLLQGTNNALSIGKAPDFLEEDQMYYSYDGNYFYTDFSLMAEDEQNNTHKNAVNKTAYYNFYQYIPHTSSSTLKAKDYNTFLESQGMTEKAQGYPCLDNQSALYDLGRTFMDVGKDSGMNASMMFATALNESGMGKSEYALIDYNLFGHAAYDENPDSATTYSSYQDCILQHAYGFLQDGYANMNDDRYHGSWFGNKASGINVMYASDPYWGEKGAHFYYLLDRANGFSDFNTIELKTELLDKGITEYEENAIHLKK